AQPPERTATRVVRQQPPAHGDELGRVVGEVGQAVGRLEHERAIVARVPGQVPEPLEREHAADRYLPGRGSLGSPSTRSPTMLRMISSVPPAMRMPGIPRTNSCHAYVPHSPESATSCG